MGEVLLTSAQAKASMASQHLVFFFARTWLIGLRGGER